MPKDLSFPIFSDYRCAYYLSLISKNYLKGTEDNESDSFWDADFLWLAKALDDSRTVSCLNI